MTGAGAAPVPESVTTRSVMQPWHGGFSGTCSVAVCRPGDSGLKATVIVHGGPPCTGFDPGQLPPLTQNEEAPLPVIAMAPSVAVAPAGPREATTYTVRGALVAPVAWLP